MSRASYQRQSSDHSVSYLIEPIPASKARAFGAGPVMLAAQTVVIFLLGLIPGALVGAMAGSAGLGVALLVAAGIAVVFVQWMRSRNARMYGQRQSAKVVVQLDAVRVEKGGDVVNIPRDRIRRVVVGNTYDENLEAQPATLVASPSTGQMAGAAIRANVDQKAPAFCYSISFHHDNSATLVVDGLDGLTARNLVDDFGRDFGMG